MAALENLGHEAFVQALYAGKSQRAAYREAFPNADKWKNKTVDNHACDLAKNAEIKARLEELQNEALAPVIAERTAKMEMLSAIALDRNLSADKRLDALDTLIQMDNDGAMHGITPNDVSLNCISLLLDPDVKPVQKRAAYLILVATFSREIVNNALLPYIAVVSRRDPLVYKWKTIVKKRDKVCQICGATKHLEAHHKSAWADDPINRVNPENGILLCAACHAKQHPNLSPVLFQHAHASG